MKKKENNKADISPLRSRAEEQLKAERAVKYLPDNEGDRERLLHELQVHQIELEMQNEELQRALAEIEKAKDKYADFYDFAPVGYVTLTGMGIISGLNLATAGFLGIERSNLVSKPFHRYIKSEFRSTFEFHLLKTLESSEKQTCELMMRRDDDSFFPILLDSIRVESEGQWVIRSVLTDITSLVAAEEALRQSERRERERAEELAAMLEAVPTPVFIVHNADATHITGNRAVEELLRQPSGAEASLSAPPDLKPRHFRAMKDGRELRLDELPARRAARGEYVRDFEFSLVFDDGTTRHVLGYGTPLLDEQRNPRGAVHVLVDITSRKLAEENIKHLASFPNFNPNPVLEVDLSGAIVFCNPASREVLKMLGMDGEDCSAFLPTDLAAILGDWDKTSESAFNREITIKDRIFDETVQLIPSLKVARIYGRDITMRKRSVETVQTTLHRFYTVLSSMYTGLLLVTDEGKVEFANQAFCDYFDLSDLPADLTGLTSSQIFAKTSKAYLCGDEAIDRIKGILEREQPVKGEEVAISSGRVLLRDFIPIHIDGKSYGRLWYHTDITDRKQAEESLRRARDELEFRVQKRTAQLRESEKIALDQMREIETYYHTAPIGLCVLDTDLRYLRINELLARWNGLPASEHLGRTLREVLPWLADEAERVVRQVTETGNPVTNMEITGEIPDQPGIRLTWLTDWHPMKDSTAKVVAISIVVQEITQQRKLEDQLHQSQKMEAIGTLAGGIAHDFNNMLAAILGFTEMALEDLPDRPEVQRSLQNVSRAAMRARDLVKQILAFSRKTGHERNPLSLTPLVKETVQLLRASIPTTIEIKFTITATSDIVLAAPVEIQQILMNLATNASFAMQQKGGTLEISLTDINFEPDSPVFGTDVSSREYVQLMVKDTGTGMGSDVMKRVFEPFFTTREVGKGTGMGLAVVYGIVKDLQGTITVESELGVGSTFSVLLPKVKTDAQAEIVQSVKVLGGNERVLFVDDEEMLVEWGRTTLGRLGYTVTAMTDSREAVKTFLSNPSLFDLVITDQAMPQMAGVQLAEELLAIKPDTPIILCTGHSDNISPDAAREIGIKEFLMKPISNQELAKAVRRVIDGKDWRLK